MVAWVLEGRRIGDIGVEERVDLVVSILAGSNYMFPLDQGKR